MALPRIASTAKAFNSHGLQDLVSNKTLIEEAITRMNERSPINIWKLV